MTYAKAGLYGVTKLKGIVLGHSHARAVIAEVVGRYGIAVADLMAEGRDNRTSKSTPFFPVLVEAIRACAEARFTDKEIGEALRRSPTRITQLRKIYSIPTCVKSRGRYAKPEQTSPSQQGEKP